MLTIYRSDMVVRSIGNSLMVILPDLLNKKIIDWFDLKRPLIAFKFQIITQKHESMSLPENNTKRKYFKQH